MKRMIRWIGLGLTFFGSVELARAATLYVKPDGSPSADGSSWKLATTLPFALTLVQSGDEVWVAQGIHNPGTGPYNSFMLKSGVGVFGGFVGTETARGQRDWIRNVTVLSGEAVSYNVVQALNIQGARLDGFTIRGGRADCPD